MIKNCELVCGLSRIVGDLESVKHGRHPGRLDLLKGKVDLLCNTPMSLMLVQMVFT